MAFCVDNRFVHSADCLLIGMIPNQQNSRNAQVVLQGRPRCASRADPLPTAIRGDIPGQSGEAALSLRWGETLLSKALLHRPGGRRDRHLPPYIEDTAVDER